MVQDIQVIQVITSDTDNSSDASKTRVSVTRLSSFFGTNENCGLGILIQFDLSIAHFMYKL